MSNTTLISLRLRCLTFITLGVMLFTYWEIIHRMHTYSSPLVNTENRKSKSLEKPELDDLIQNYRNAIIHENPFKISDTRKGIRLYKLQSNSDHYKAIHRILISTLNAEADWLVGLVEGNPIGIEIMLYDKNGKILFIRYLENGYVVIDHHVALLNTNYYKQLNEIVIALVNSLK